MKKGVNKVDIINQSDVNALSNEFKKKDMLEQVKILVEIGKNFTTMLTEIIKNKNQLANQLMTVYGKRLDQLGNPEYLLQISAEERILCFNESIEIRLAMESLKNKEDKKQDINSKIRIGFGLVSLALLPKVIREIGNVMVKIKKG